MRGAEGKENGYLDQLWSVRNCQSVTGAVMAVRRSVFEHAGGFDEVALPMNSVTSTFACEYAALDCGSLSCRSTA